MVIGFSGWSPLTAELKQDECLGQWVLRSVLVKDTLENFDQNHLQGKSLLCSELMRMVPAGGSDVPSRIDKRVLLGGQLFAELFTPGCTVCNATMRRIL